MKKIFTLIIVFMATLSVMAQGHGAMNFVGTSTFYVTQMQDATTTQTENDKVTLTLTGDGSKQADIVIPDMQYDMNGNIMVIKSFTANSGVEYTMTGSYMTGDMVFEWAEGNFSTTTTGVDGNEKSITGTVSAKYLHNAKQLEVSVNFFYGSMPFQIHYEMTGNYAQTAGINNLNSLSLGEGWGEAYNLAGQRVGSDAKGLLIVGGKKVIR